MAIIGIIAIVIGGVLLFTYFSNKKKLEEMMAVETSTTDMLHQLCQEIANDIGGGSFEQKTEVKGVVECDQPLE